MFNGVCESLHISHYAFTFNHIMLYSLEKMLCIRIYSGSVFQLNFLMWLIDYPQLGFVMSPVGILA